MSSSSCFILSHTRLRCVTLTTTEGIFIYHISYQEVFLIVIDSRNKVKTTRVIYASNHAGIGGKCNVHFTGWNTNVWRGCFISVELCMAPDINLLYDQPVRTSSYPQRKFYVQLLNPTDGGSFTLASLTNISHQVNLRSLRSPCLFNFYVR